LAVIHQPDYNNLHTPPKTPTIREIVEQKIQQPVNTNVRAIVLVAAGTGGPAIGHHIRS
jgi:hypothetical protein